MPKTPSPVPVSPQISTVFANQLFDDFHMNETIRASPSQHSDDREELCRADMAKQSMRSWAEHKEKAKRHKRVLIFAFLGLIALLLLALTGLGMRHSTQQDQLSVQKKQIKVREEQIEGQKKLINLHLNKLALATNGSEIREEHLELQKALLKFHERSNQTMVEILNQTTVQLEECMGHRNELGMKLWEVQVEGARLKRREEQMEATLNLTEGHIEAQKKLITSMKDERGEMVIGMRKKEETIGEMKKDIEGKQEEIERLQDSLVRYNDTLEDLAGQMLVLNNNLKSKEIVINGYEEQLKILRVVNESKVAHEERADAMQEQVEMMRKQLETRQQVYDTEHRLSENLRLVAEKTDERNKKHMEMEKERREELAAQLREIKESTCYRANCRYN